MELMFPCYQRSNKEFNGVTMQLSLFDYRPPAPVIVPGYFAAMQELNAMRRILQGECAWLECFHAGKGAAIEVQAFVKDTQDTFDYAIKTLKPIHYQARPEWFGELYYDLWKATDTILYASTGERITTLHNFHLYASRPFNFASDRTSLYSIKGGV